MPSAAIDGKTLNIELEMTVPVANALIRIMKAGEYASPSDAIGRALLRAEEDLAARAIPFATRRV
ncbi:MAG: hypothetical protein ACU0CO_15705 [Shimia sp.]